MAVLAFQYFVHASASESLQIKGNIGKARFLACSNDFISVIRCHDQLEILRLQLYAGKGAVDTHAALSDPKTVQQLFGPLNGVQFFLA